MEYTVHINDTGELKATTGDQSGTDLLFNDLKNRLVTCARKQVNGEIWEYVVLVERDESLCIVVEYTDVER